MAMLNNQMVHFKKKTKNCDLPGLHFWPCWFILFPGFCWYLNKRTQKSLGWWKGENVCYFLHVTAVFFCKLKSFLIASGVIKRGATWKLPNLHIYNGCPIGTSYIFLWFSHGKNRELPSHLWWHQLFAELVRTSMRSSVSCHLCGYDSVNWRPCRRPDLFWWKESASHGLFLANPPKKCIV